MQRYRKDEEKLCLRSHVYFSVTRATYDVCGDVQRKRVMEWFQPGVTLSPRDVWLLRGKRGGITGIYWVKARDTAKHPTLLRAAPTTE